MCTSHSPRAHLSLSIAFALVIAATSDARAAGSEASALSLLPVAVVSAASTRLLEAGAMLTVIGVEASAQGTDWVVERVSDGARATLRLAGRASVAVGTVVAVSAADTGYVLSAAGQAIACIPGALGAALLYSERVSP